MLGSLTSPDGLKHSSFLSFHGIYYRYMEESMEEENRDRRFAEELKPFSSPVRHNRRKVLNYYWCIYTYLTEATPRRR